MVLPSTPPSAARPNSVATKYQNSAGRGRPLKCAWMASSILLETDSIRTGRSATKIRHASPPATTPRPDSQTILISGGMFLRARIRFFQSPQKVFESSAISYTGKYSVATRDDCGACLMYKGRPNRYSSFPGQRFYVCLITGEIL